jgi:Protein of unknown function (DUF1761)
VKVNYIAAVATGFAAFGLSLLWYSPLVFGNIWTSLRSAPLHPLPGWTLVFAPLREIVTALFLAHLFVPLRLGSWPRALAFGVVLWVAFYAVQMTGAVLWDNMPWRLGLVHAGDWLMKLTFMSVVLNAWQSKAEFKGAVQRT